jgi:hypothetical protein
MNDDIENQQPINCNGIFNLEAKPAGIGHGLPSLSFIEAAVSSFKRNAAIEPFDTTHGMH